LSEPGCSIPFVNRIQQEQRDRADGFVRHTFKIQNCEVTMSALQDFANSNAVRILWMSSTAFEGPLKNMKDDSVPPPTCLVKAPGQTNLTLNSLGEFGFHAPIDFDVVFQPTGPPDPKYQFPVGWVVDQAVNQSFNIGSQVLRIDSIQGSVPGRLSDVNQFVVPCGSNGLNTEGQGTVGIVKDGPYLLLKVMGALDGKPVTDSFMAFIAFDYGTAVPKPETLSVSYEIQHLLQLMRFWFDPPVGPGDRERLETPLYGAISMLARYLPEGKLRQEIHQITSRGISHSIRRRK
jgi:hypothetical protein